MYEDNKIQSTVWRSGGWKEKEILTLGKLGKLCEQDLQTDLARNVETCFKDSPLSHWEKYRKHMAEVRTGLGKNAQIGR